MPDNRKPLTLSSDSFCKLCEGHGVLRVSMRVVGFSDDEKNFVRYNATFRTLCDCVSGRTEIYKEADRIRLDGLSLEAQGICHPLEHVPLAVPQFSQPDVSGELRQVSGPEEVGDLARTSADRVKQMLAEADVKERK